ncbi:MAG: ATP-binding protein, partial [Propionibacteriaceae bacterium]|nr:ATP-binding protein [Propionibacteriaceae bacterium]
AYVDCADNEQMADLFARDFDIPRLVRGLEVAAGQRIEPGTTLIALDEVQAVPRALTALKYFRERAPEHHVAVAGSLLGVALREGVSFPVGQVDFLDLAPLTFAEFLAATGNERFATLLEAAEPDFALIEPFHAQLMDRLRAYMTVGGLPEAVADYAESRSLLGVRDLQRAILDAYDQDISKHAPAEIVPKCRSLFRSLPAQLAEENKRFFFSHVGPGVRAKTHGLALSWLTDAGHARKVRRVNRPGLPLSAYANDSFFKLFALDVGLLAALSRVPADAVLSPDALFREFRGALAEQLVCQELAAGGAEPYYFARDDSRGEIDFIVQSGGAVVPIEVKSGANLAARSLANFASQHGLGQAVKISTLPYRANAAAAVVNVPLYLAGRAPDLAAGRPADPSSSR